jgi:thioester reductase-like protein
MPMNGTVEIDRPEVAEYAEHLSRPKRVTAANGARGTPKQTRDGISSGVLLTGATGFVGMQLLARYLESTERRVYLLVRGGSDGEVAARVKNTLRCLFGPDHPYAERVVAVRGDITRPCLGIRRSSDRLADQVSEIVHCAATVSFELGLEASRATNVDGTARMLEFAERCQGRGGLRRFTYISTAYVAGEHRGRFSEDDLDVGQRFRNPYEQSKFEAECLVAQQRKRLPVTVLRPSIIVGERSNGWTVSFNVLYWPLRAFARGLFTAVPAVASAPVDVVSVDYVADAAYELCSREAFTPGETFHLTAGADASTIGEIAAAASRYFKRPLPKVVPPAEFAADNAMVAGSAAYFPYFSVRAEFDDARARAALRPAGISVTPLRDYMDRLLDFATRSRWGKRPITRFAAVASMIVPA